MEVEMAMAMATGGGGGVIPSCGGAMAPSPSIAAATAVVELTPRGGQATTSGASPASEGLLLRAITRRGRGPPLNCSLPQSQQCKDARHVAAGLTARHVTAGLTAHHVDLRSLQPGPSTTCSAARFCRGQAGVRQRLVLSTPGPCLSHHRRPVSAHDDVENRLPSTRTPAHTRSSHTTAKDIRYLAAAAASSSSPIFPLPPSNGGNNNANNNSNNNSTNNTTNNDNNNNSSLTVCDVMTGKGIVSVKMTTTIDDALQSIVDHRISGLPVVDEDYRLVGVVSDYDLLAFNPAAATTMSGSRSASAAAESAIPNDRSIFAAPSAASNTWKTLWRKMEGKTVCDVMTPRPLAVRSTSNLEDAVRLLLECKYKRLPVVDDNGKLVGILSRADVVKMALRLRAASEAKPPPS